VTKEMSKGKIYALLLMMLLTVTTSTVIVSATGIIKIQFNASASGPCAVVYGLGTRGTDPIPDQEIWYWGEGTGATAIRGETEKLKPIEFTKPDWGDGYESKELTALGYVSVRWTDGEENNWLVAVIYSTSSTYGFFKPNELISMPIPGITPTPKYKENLNFIGIHVIGSEVQRIKGFALYLTAPLASIGWPGPGYVNGVGLGIPLEGDDLIIYQLMWSDVFPGIPGVPLAEAIQWNVEEG